MNELCRHHHHQQHQHNQYQQQMTNPSIVPNYDGSLDNIQMIVDEENPSFTSPDASKAAGPIVVNPDYIFVTSDEDNKMNTLRPANHSNRQTESQQLAATSVRGTSDTPYPRRASESTNNNNNNSNSKGSDAAIYLRGAEHVVNFDDLNLQEIQSEPRANPIVQQQQQHNHLQVLAAAPPLPTPTHADGNEIESNSVSVSTTYRRRRPNRPPYHLRKYLT